MNKIIILSLLFICYLFHGINSKNNNNNEIVINNTRIINILKDLKNERKIYTRYM